MATCAALKTGVLHPELCTTNPCYYSHLGKERFHAFELYIRVDKVSAEALTVGYVQYINKPTALGILEFVSEGCAGGTFKNLTKEQFTEMKSRKNLRGMENFSTVEQFNKRVDTSGNGWAVAYPTAESAMEKQAGEAVLSSDETMEAFKNGNMKAFLRAAKTELIANKILRVEPFP